MSTRENAGVMILVVDDVEEVRDGLAALLESDGYHVEAVRSEAYAIECALRRPPQLILVNLAGPPTEVIAAARRIRHNTNVQDRVPVVLFCVEGIDGTEVDLGEGLCSTQPDNFNQLRRLLLRLLYPASEH